MLLLRLMWYLLLDLMVEAPLSFWISAWLLKLLLLKLVLLLNIVAFLGSPLGPLVWFLRPSLVLVPIATLCLLVRLLWLTSVIFLPVLHRWSPLLNWALMEAALLLLLLLRLKPHLGRLVLLELSVAVIADPRPLSVRLRHSRPAPLAGDATAVDAAAAGLQVQIRVLAQGTPVGTGAFVRPPLSRVHVHILSPGHHGQDLGSLLLGKAAQVQVGWGGHRGDGGARLAHGPGRPRGGEPRGRAEAPLGCWSSHGASRAGGSPGAAALAAHFVAHVCPGRGSRGDR